MDANAVKSLLDLGTVAVFAFATITIWKAYNARIDAHIADLKSMIAQLQKQPPPAPPPTVLYSPLPDLTPSPN